MFTLVLGGRRSGKSLWAENEALAVASSMHAGSGKLLYIATAPPPLPGDVEMQRRISEHRQRRESQLSMLWEETSGQPPVGNYPEGACQSVDCPVGACQSGDYQNGDSPLVPGLDESCLGQSDLGQSCLNEGCRGETFRPQAHLSGQTRQWVTIEEPINLLSCVKNNTVAGFDLIFIDCITLWLFNLMQQGKTDKGILQEVKELADFLAAVSLPVFSISNEVGMGVAPVTELGNRFCDLAGRVNQLLAKKAKRVVFVAAGLPLFLK